MNRMRTYEVGEAYHIEKAIAARMGITRYRCGCEICHGFKTQTTEIVDRHHRRFGQDIHLVEPLLRHPDSFVNNMEELSEGNNDEAFEVPYEDPKIFEGHEDPESNTNIDYKAMAESFLARVDEIHNQGRKEQDSIVDFQDLSSAEDEADKSEVLEYIYRESTRPLYPGSNISSLQFSTVLMSLCTLFCISHSFLDELLTFIKEDILPKDNNYPKNSYEMKTMLMKLGLGHETIHYCPCGKVLYWKQNLDLKFCPVCNLFRFVEGSSSVLCRVLRYFSLINRLQRMFRSPEIAKLMQWHANNQSQDGKMRSVIDGEQWRFIQNR